MIIIYNIHGDYTREYLSESMRCCRRCVAEAKQEIWTTGEAVDRISCVKYGGDKYPAGVRGSDMVRVDALLAQTGTCCYMDSDIYPVSIFFAEGFKIAETYGMAMVMNPRRFINTPHGNGDYEQGNNAMMWTSVNLGLIFYSPKHEQANKFLETWRLEQHKDRNQFNPRAAFIHATIAARWHPHILPTEWCAENPSQNVIAMHVGGKYHKHMMEYYDEYHRS